MPDTPSTAVHRGSTVTYNQLLDIKQKVNANSDAKFLEQKNGVLYSNPNPNNLSSHVERSKAGLKTVKRTRDLVKSAFTQKFGTKVADKLFQQQEKFKKSGNAMMGPTLSNLVRDADIHQMETAITEMNPDKRKVHTQRIVSFQKSTEVM